MLGGHGGNIYEMARRLGCAQSEVIDMRSNINPLGPPPGLVNYSDNFRPNIGRRIKSIDSEDTVFICNPNNPTGSLIPKQELEWLIADPTLVRILSSMNHTCPLSTSVKKRA